MQQTDLICSKPTLPSAVRLLISRAKLGKLSKLDIKSVFESSCLRVMGVSAQVEQKLLSQLDLGYLFALVFPRLWLHGAV